MPFRIQEFFLEVCGICQRKPSSLSLVTKLQRIFGFLLIVGGWFSFLLNALVAAWAIATPDTKWKVNPIIQSLCLTPYASINLQAVLVVTIFFFKEKQWRRLAQSAKELITANLFQGYKSSVRNFRLFALFLTVGSLFLLVTWEVLDGRSYVVLNNQTAFSDDVLKPLSLPMEVYWYYIFWGFCGSLPFFLSQQIFICLLLHAKILKDCCRAVNTSLFAEVGRVRVANQVGKVFSATSLPELHYVMKSKHDPSVLSTCRKIKQRYMKLYLHCEELNDTFGNILFLIVILDLLTAFGFTACLTGNDGGKIIVTNVFDIVSIIIFMAYTTIYAWPMVSAYEQSTKLGGIVAQLLFEIESQSSHRRETETVQEETKSLLLTFLIGSKDQVLMFVAGGLMSITRGFVVTTLTLLLSFLLIAREFSKYKF